MNDGPVIVFDGNCVLCSASAQFVLRHDHDRLFRFTTAQSAYGRKTYLDHGLDPVALSTMIVIADGRAFTESGAVLMVLGALGWPWRLALVTRVVPRAIRDRLYRFVARNRYRWVGRRAVCWSPTPDVADRIL